MNLSNKNKKQTPLVVMLSIPIRSRKTVKSQKVNYKNSSPDIPKISSTNMSKFHS